MKRGIELMTILHCHIFYLCISRIVIAVLDAFHFDISSSELATKAVLPPIRTLKGKKDLVSFQHCTTELLDLI